MNRYEVEQWRYAYKMWNLISETPVAFAPDFRFLKAAGPADETVTS